MECFYECRTMYVYMRAIFVIISVIRFIVYVIRATLALALRISVYFCSFSSSWSILPILSYRYCNMF